MQGIIIQTFFEWAANPVVEIEGLPNWSGGIWLIVWLAGLLALSRAAAVCGSRRHGFWITFFAGTLGFLILAATILCTAYFLQMLPDYWPSVWIMCLASVLVSMLLIAPILRVLRAGYGGALCAWAVTVIVGLLSGYLVASAAESLQSGRIKTQQNHDRVRAVNTLIHSVGHGR